jgi:hypothetical protein
MQVGFIGLGDTVAANPAPAAPGQERQSANEQHRRQF